MYLLYLRFLFALSTLDFPFVLAVLLLRRRLSSREDLFNAGKSPLKSLLSCLVAISILRLLVVGF